jgi:bifunctional DNase/RNase
MREMKPAQIAVSAREGTPVLLLREADGDRWLPIWIGGAEAEAIALAASGAPMPRPLTHALIAEVVEAFGQRLRKIVITSIRENTYLAELVFDGDVRVSARPSDAIALALRVGAGIHAEDRVLEQAAVLTAELGMRGARPADADADAEYRAQLEQFRNFLDHARPEDFDPGEGNPGQT